MRRIALLVSLCLLVLGATSAVAQTPDKSRKHASSFPANQCTSWAYKQRPEIVNAGLAKGLTDWNAWKWAANAKQAGFVVDKAPRRGAIAVWPRNVDGAVSTGHVAYVRSVKRNGSISVSEVNFNGKRGPANRTVKRSTVRKLQFIHGLR